jgi:hypothetical protein
VTEDCNVQSKVTSQRALSTKARSYFAILSSWTSHSTYSICWSMTDPTDVGCRPPLCLSWLGNSPWWPTRLTADPTLPRQTLADECTMPPVPHRTRNPDKAYVPKHWLRHTGVPVTPPLNGCHEPTQQPSFRPQSLFDMPSAQEEM